jgi:hypothetical protein
MANLAQVRNYHVVLTFSDADEHAAFVAGCEAAANLQAGEFYKLRSAGGGDDDGGLSAVVKAAVLAHFDE